VIPASGVDHSLAIKALEIGSDESDKETEIKRTRRTRRNKRRKIFYSSSSESH
jgi:hypothetical protein